MNNNRPYMHGYWSPCKWFFNSSFLSPLSNYNKLAWQNKKEEENNHPTTKPNATTKHRNLAQKISQNQHKINPKSTEKKLENPTQNQDKPTGKPNSKSIKTHQETQPKNSPNPSKNPAQTILNKKLTWNAQQSRICRSICYRRVFHCCRRLGVGGEGLVVEERGRGKGEREAKSADRWGGDGGGELGVSWIGELGVGEGKRETGEWAEKGK